MNQDLYLLFPEAKERHIQSYNKFNSKTQECIDFLLKKLNAQIDDAINAENNTTYIEVSTLTSCKDSFYTIMENKGISPRLQSVITNFILNTLRTRGYLVEQQIQHVYRVSW